MAQQTAFEVLQSKLTIEDTFEFREKHLPEILSAMEEYKNQKESVTNSHKLTAVEWFIDRIKNQHLYGFTPLHKLEEQAKAMEKEQIMDACVKFGNNNGVDIEDYEQYYNETYTK